MEVGNGAQRFPVVNEVLKQVALGDSISFGIDGTPNCQIRLHPRQSLIQVFVKDDDSLPDVASLQNLAHSSQTIDGTTWNGVSISWRDSPIETYLFACAVVDRLQLNRENLAEAVAAAVVRMRELVQRQFTLSIEEEIGLVGELLVLSCLMNQHDAEKAASYWKGPENEEHDFALPGVDLEVKTTSSESRRHWISSLTQLSALPGRPLRLVSIQLTPKNGLEAISLPELVAHVLNKASVAYALIERQLSKVGYHHDHAELYARRWALRDSILEFEVDDTFPKITLAELHKMGYEGNEVSAVKYSLDLGSRSAADMQVLSGIQVIGDVL